LYPQQPSSALNLIFNTEKFSKHYAVFESLLIGKSVVMAGRAESMKTQRLA
jgi:Na+-transporting NADH:ubiquinone oxidoreductase subunit NqrD